MSKPSLSYLEEKLVSGNGERALLQDPADAHHRVRPHDVHGQARTECRQIVRAVQSHSDRERAKYEVRGAHASRMREGIYHTLSSLAP